MRAMLLSYKVRDLSFVSHGMIYSKWMAREKRARGVETMSAENKTYRSIDLHATRLHFQLRHIDSPRRLRLPNGLPIRMGIVSDSG